MHWTTQSHSLPACNHVSHADSKISLLCLDYLPPTSALLQSQGGSASSPSGLDTALQLAITTASHTSGPAPSVQNGSVSQTGPGIYTYYLFIIQDTEPPDSSEGSLPVEDCTVDFKSSCTAEETGCDSSCSSSINSSTSGKTCENSGAACTGSSCTQKSTSSERAETSGCLSHVVTMGEHRHAWIQVSHRTGWLEVIRAAREAARELISQVFTTSGWSLNQG